MRLLSGLAGVALTLSITGCAAGTDGIGYYWQSISGHLALMRATRPIDVVIADPATRPALRAKLDYARQVREFAVSALALPDNGSYRGYAELGRPQVLWNVFATPELSLQLLKWCFPVAGCVAYRGYYDQADAKTFADGLAASGYDVRVGDVPAYSTLGWFDDPLPSPVLAWPEAEIARLIFHELAHQVVYLKGDSTFNESFATTVENVGVSRWLAHREAVTGDPGPRQRHQAQAARKQDFLALLLATRAQLDAIYGGSGSDEQRRAAKVRAFDRLRENYREMRDSRWNGYRGYDRWFEQPLGNAHLAAVGAYNDDVPKFERLLSEVGDDLPRFYEAVKALAGLDAGPRRARLARLAPAS